MIYGLLTGIAGQFFFQSVVFVPCDHKYLRDPVDIILKFIRLTASAD